MKKTLTIIALSIALFSCKKEYVEPETQQVINQKIAPDRNQPDSIFKRPTVIINLPK